MSKTYRAIKLNRFADTFRAAGDIETIDGRNPGPGEVTVRNLHCGINGIFDTQIARNAVDYVRVALPSFTGVEAAGIVEAVGDGAPFAVGDAVATVRFTGGYRERNTAPANNFAALPEASRVWLALASSGVSAKLALDYVGDAQPGETVIVSAAAGGLGHLIVQLALLRGCHVVAVAGGPRKTAFLRSLGAHRVIDYKTERIGEVLADEYLDRIDVAIDSVGGELFDAYLDNLAQHGRLVVAGAVQDMTGKPGASVGAKVIDKLYYKGASVRGFMNGLLTDHWPDARANVFRLHAEGKLSVTFDEQPFKGLPQVYDAVERLLSGQSMGKVMVDLYPET